MAAGKYWPEIKWYANQFPDGNGDGYLFYPDKKNNRVHGSLRLSVLRDGLEDMEYFLLMQECKETALKRGTQWDLKWLRKVKEIECEIPRVIAGETEDDGRNVSRNFNGDQLETVRRQLGNLLDDYYQTNRTDAE